MADNACELFDCGHRACGGCGCCPCGTADAQGCGHELYCGLLNGMHGSLLHAVPRDRVEGSRGSTRSSRTLLQVASGIEASLKKQGRKEKVIVMAGDGATFDIGMLCISGAFERGHDITYICYDNEAYMNTGIQRSGATPYDASTTTSPAGSQSFGNKRPKKDMPQILAAHGAPYVATASVAYPNDMIQKVEKAINTVGPNLRAAPCPLLHRLGFRRRPDDCNCKTGHRRPASG